MKKLLIIIFGAFITIQAHTVQVGLPIERLAMPAVTGSHLVCIWDDTTQSWIDPDFESYDQSGIYEFQVPSWDKWYWVGLWDEGRGEYVYGKWIGHFLTD